MASQSNPYFVASSIDIDNCQSAAHPGCAPGFASAASEPLMSESDGFWDFSGAWAGVDDQFPKRVEEASPCCAGFFCPAGLACMLRESSLTTRERVVSLSTTHSLHHGLKGCESQVEGSSSMCSKDRARRQCEHATMCIPECSPQATSPLGSPTWIPPTEHRAASHVPSATPQMPRVFSF